MKTIDEYAIELVVDGAESVAEDDLNESEDIADADHQAACDLAIKIAHAIRRSCWSWSPPRRARPMAEPLGFLVLIREYDTWNATWDGEVHPTREAAEEQARLAHAAAYEAVAVALTPFPTNTEGGTDA